MSIEAMKKAMAALESCAPADTSSGHVIYPSFDEKLVDQACEALRTAIQQAEAQQPATPEPVAWRYQPEDGLKFPGFTQYEAVAVSRGKPGTVLPLYTHPAPGVPEQDWERKERLQSIADTAAASGLFGLAQKWANNEIHSYQFTHQAAAIVLKAMLAASS